jgi:hypothetical protein
MRDQRQAVAALAAADRQEVPAAQPAAGSEPVAGSELGDSEAGAEEAAAPAQAMAAAAAGPAAAAVHVASVERGRIATMGGVVGLIWLAILVLMVWNS